MVNFHTCIGPFTVMLCALATVYFVVGALELRAQGQNDLPTPTHTADAARR
jgi:hypothetical protein